MPSQAFKDYVPNENLTFEKVWAMFQETKEQMKETDRKMQENAEQIKETDKLIKENAKLIKETRLQMKETDRRIGELGNRFGELAEHLVAPSIMEKFNALGFSFTQSSKNIEIHEAGEAKSYAEIDILLEDGDFVIAVEVKAKPNEKDVDKHIERMEILRWSADKHNDKRKYRGAIAGAIMTKNVREYVIQEGMYVIEQTGDTVCINIPEGFKPCEW
jgi:hypothetical protein